jgi:hypothetical protein
VTTNTKLETTFPIRGVAGGWRDLWGDPDDHAELRVKAEATERRQLRRAAVLGAVWRAQIAAETLVHAPRQQNRPA